MGAPTFAQIGARIREIRESKSITQKQLSEALQVTRPVITKIESGNKAVNAVELKIIADALGTTIDVFMSVPTEESLVARFRAKGDNDREFLEAVNQVEGLFRDILGQLRIRRS